MKNHVAATLILVLCSIAAGAQSGTNGQTPTNAPTSASPNAKTGTQTSTKTNTGGTTVQLPGGIAFHAELTKSLYSKNARVGDQVTAKVAEELSDGTMQVHTGSKLVGHVTQAQAYTQESREARLAIVFDKVILTDGKEIEFHGTIDQYQRPTRIIANGISSSDNPAHRASSQSADPNYEPNPRTSGAAWNSDWGQIAGVRYYKVIGSGFTDKRNFKLESGARIVVRVQ